MTRLRRVRRYSWACSSLVPTEGSQVPALIGARYFSSFVYSQAYHSGGIARLFEPQTRTSSVMKFSSSGSR